ncbi:hypothetical protein [Candidatus Absconditicoccus praedator]|uniref:hypothetical protein n=1 Tax=Candidatus Absconditicoccus praedator TaxID=2735562 RepID=UPI001E3F05E6|nr:hypothetical protein [Candidatus Absconditicoccus praedator]UFX82845.1 hypothetical protein HLG78_01770 [Candidatus Absconditicoccus praedator]
MKTKIIFLTLVLLFFVPIAKASVLDCSKVADGNYDEVLPSGKNIITKKHIELAYDHLRGYCCNVYSSRIDCDGNDGDSGGMDSALLFEHLMNLGFRSLDGREDLAYGLPMDDEGLERRNEISELAMDTDGVSGDDVLNKFEEYWGEEINIYNEDTLAGKYGKVCEEAKIIADNVDVYKGDQIDITTLYNSCTSMANARVRKEIGLVQNIAISASRRQQSNNFDQYAYDYFARNRLMELGSGFSRFEGTFNSVAKQVTEGTAQCNN